jgi:pilus assembly protein Flp/PilA
MLVARRYLNDTNSGPRGHPMLDFIRSIRPRREENGASAVEYGLLVAGIAALIVAIVFLLGGVIKGSFSKTCGTISSKGSSTATC